MAKEILKDEILSAEQLDAVAGGNIGQTAEDSKILYEYGRIDDWHGNITTIFNWSDYSAKVREGWKKFGIRCETNAGGNNHYYYGFTQISRNKAIEFLKLKYEKVRSAD